MKLRALIPAVAISLSAFSAHAYNGSNGEYCREFTKTIYVGGRPQQGYGSSCLQPDGSWQIVQQPQVAPAYYNAPPPVQYVQPVRYVQAQPYYAAYPRPCNRQPAWPFFLSVNYSNRDRDWHQPQHRGWRDNGRHDGHADRRGNGRDGGRHWN